MVERRTIQVDGMGCRGCEDTVEDALLDVAGVRGAEADHEAGEVTVEVDEHTADDLLAEAIESVDYRVASAT